MKRLFGLLLVLVLLPAVLAISVDIEKTSSDETMIVDLNKPTSFNLEITNKGTTQKFSLYSLGHFSFSSFETNEGLNSSFEIERDETLKLEVPVYMRQDSNLRGKTSFTYYLQAADRTEVDKKLTLNLVELEDAFNIMSGEINPDSQEMTIIFENDVNFKFENISVEFDSPFFSFDEVLTLSPYEQKEFTIELEKEEFDKLMAGFYTMTAKVKLEDLKATVEGKIEFIEKDDLLVQKKDYGFLIVTKVIEKSNEGNTIAESETTIKKNILSRLFTTYNPEPDQVERQGATVYYTWAEKLNPGESIEITVKTNWLIPILIIIFIVSIIHFAKKYITEKVQVRKRVSFVKAKGGEFALKVTIIAEAREFVEKVKIIDRLPPLVKMYERFGGELPDKVSKDKKRLEWDFEYLDAGERRIMTYIVYSKVGVLGRFALPGTICRYEKEGKQKQSLSNKAFFLAEQKDRKYAH